MKKYTIRKRKDGRYEARVTIDYQRHSVYGQTKVEVQRKLQKLLRDAERGVPVNAGEKLGDAMQTYLEAIVQPRVMATTYDRMENTVKNHIKAYPISNKKIGKVLPTDISKLLMDLAKKGLSESSVKKVYHFFGEFFRYMKTVGELKLNPMELVKFPHVSHFKNTKKKLESLTEEEFTKVIEVAEHCTDGEPDYRYGEAIILMLLTGIRAGECRGIQYLSDIDMEEKTLHIQRNITCAKNRQEDEPEKTKTLVVDPKTENSDREIPLNDRALLAIKRLLKTTYDKESDNLVCTSNGNIVTHSNLSKQYSAILKKAGVRHMGIHSTRHTFATLLLKHASGDGRIKEISEILGHADVSITYKFYISTSNKDKRGLVNLLNNYKKWGKNGVKNEGEDSESSVKQ